MDASEAMIIGGVEDSLLQALVPINALTTDHLKTLLRDQNKELVFAGQTLFESGAQDGNYVYLLSGEVRVFDANGVDTILAADDPQSRYPLCHYQPRQHKVHAKTDCVVMRFSSEQLNAMIAWDQASRYIQLDLAGRRDLDEDADWMLELLRSNFFYKVPPMNIRQVLDRFEPVCFSSGETVLRQGEVGDSCYFIKEGVAAVYQSPDERSAPKQVAELSEGRCFGEDALLSDAPRNATVIMQTNGVLMRLAKQDFYLLLKALPVAADNFAQLSATVPFHSQWLDARTQDEFDHGHLEGAINLPLDILILKARMLDHHTPYAVYCNSGHRSQAACYFLQQEGFQVTQLSGGFESLDLGQQSLFESGD